jgi:type VI secretion system secreted protein VgrG
MSKDKRIGSYVGTVEYNRDPYHWGRVQVRVDEVYGTKEETPSNMLPWARVMQFGGGFYDGGSHWIPPVGATVVVSFEKGDSDLPYVMGTIPKKPTKNNSYGRSGESMGPWGPGSYDTDVPKEVKTDGEETTMVVFKTPKGAALVISEQDGNEFVRLIDRSGQMIEMISNVCSSDNQGNASQRGTVVAPGVIGSGKVTVGKIRILDLELDHITLDMKTKTVQIESKGDLEKTVAGNETDDITGDMTQDIGGNKEETIEGDHSQTIEGDQTVEVTQGQTIDVTVDRAITVLGKETKEITGTWDVTVIGIGTLKGISLTLQDSTGTAIIGVAPAAITLTAPIINIV